MPESISRQHIEERLRRLCKGVLRTQELPEERNLLTLGASSLDVILVLTQAHDELGMELPAAAEAQGILADLSLRGLVDYMWQAAQEAKRHTTLR
jgi:acyl carrier protein